MLFSRPWQYLLCLLLLQIRFGLAILPTWPSSIDELEDIMYLNNGYRARNFSAKVTPCAFSAEGHGRIAAAEWIRTAFHDMAPGNVFSGTGGLDASIMFELSGPTENVGAAFATTLTTFSPYFSNQSSMADLIALGVYTAVRSCRGPIIAIRAGRKDATAAGPPGVPLPQNSLGTFRNQFARVGFNVSEMISVTACGHTLGGVHAENFPQIVTPGSAPNDFIHFDSTTAFDEKVATEYVSGNTTNPLVSGPCVGSNRCSDAAVYAADDNATITTMADPNTFRKICAIVLQKMVEVVPKSVTLTDPIQPYEVKPVGLQLSVLDGGQYLIFSGEVRIKHKGESRASRVELRIKDRIGGTDCGECKILTHFAGTANGFDHSFDFYGFSIQLSAAKSISSFVVDVTFSDGSSYSYDNNGAGFSVQDIGIFQFSQSSLEPRVDANGSRNLTIVGAIRQAAPSTSANLSLVVQSPRPSDIPVPALQTISLNMKPQFTIGLYTLFAVSYALPSNQANTAKFNIISGSSVDTTQNVHEIQDVAYPLASPLPTDPTAVKPEAPVVNGFAYQGCQTDSSAARVLEDKGTWSANMTTAMCSSFCAGYQYFGTEYTTECYCGNELAAASISVQESDCWMKCPGDAKATCGGTSRISLYKSTKFVPVATKPVDIPSYAYRGCYADAVSSRTLKDSYFYGEDMTTTKCASLCKGSTYFGTEYGGECYCGKVFPQRAVEVSASECSLACKGDKTQACGAGNRLSVYWKIP